MRVREYEGYEAYLKHQRAKTEKVLAGTCKELGPFWPRVRMFQSLFQDFPKHLPRGRAILCLGARRGEEVQAFRDMGYRAIGVDLVAFPPLVMEGDFHSLPFGDESTDGIFANVIDHVHDLAKFGREVTRVLKPKGIGFFHLQLGRWSEEVSLMLETPQELIAAFPGFGLLASEPIQPYGGGLNHLLILEKPT